MSDEQRRQDLADFLRTRRMRLSPEQIGLRNGGRRRTPGLRREEVAHLANVGVSWYTLLEQGHDIHPSREVLHNIADALQLTSAERQHLFLLADQAYHVTTAPSQEQVSPALRRVLDGLEPMPAYALGRRWDFLAWNATAEQVFSLSTPVPLHDYNAVWRVFVDPRSRQIYRKPTWEQVAQKVMEEFRADSVHFADEEWFKRLLADLQRESPEFREMWPHHDVRDRNDGLKGIEHPQVGLLLFEHTTLQVPALPNLKIMIYTPLPETGTEEKLKQLMDQNITIGAV
ncbi:XRE family transcriptional regulator [Ktedonosporobacter rubrisoli]|uniref:XRE family transcriptional regulator n=1 Tax=Ktedonosporobacter rubrisoli TaxID=2509675 RepID=A0A4P6JW41_KTERU|nr:helix-turn-helix transcriptional regulator [Ktedonosporobacter rubrisoli]QBD79685.1 XRE family transcriptional regulator [Ktedonosporobacter rubrisoli]